ncbi:MAG: carboxypeptidase-like regulatory domain-containing protein [Saprospiraceae bacterium]|nr:carboxypeptidase-like regulatory domain-containing protein [Saprospiraceae bacterium]
MNKITWGFLFYFFCNSILSQVNSLTFSGQLFEEGNETPIPGATVLLNNVSDQFESVTDAAGKFIFKKLPAGHYQLSFRSLGYQAKSIAEIEINTGISRQQIFRLSQAGESLEEVVVKAESRARVSESVTSIYTLTVEESFRFPGTFYDPARLATHYAGVINENDQANNLVVRGNSPNGLGWYLEGVEIVNPNHLSNAGTLNDRSSQSGGGVNILSAQMLDNSTFLTGAFPAYYGNATTGIFDMRLREGASDHTHYTAQIGLIGIDAAMEGPMNKNKKNSF